MKYSTSCKKWLLRTGLTLPEWLRAHAGGPMWEVDFVHWIAKITESMVWNGKCIMALCLWYSNIKKKKTRAESHSWSWWIIHQTLRFSPLIGFLTNALTHAVSCGTFRSWVIMNCVPMQTLLFCLGCCADMLQLPACSQSQPIKYSSLLTYPMLLNVTAQVHLQPQFFNCCGIIGKRHLCQGAADA